MHTKIHWITDSFGTMPRPRGKDWLQDEILGLKKQGATTILSLLEQSEVEELGLVEERNYAVKTSLHFIHYPIPDFSVPKILTSFSGFIDNLITQFEEGKRLAIHCRAGIGRSTIVACSILLKQGYSTDEALQLITQKRGVKVPDTKEQVKWLKDFEHHLRR